MEKDIKKIKELELSEKLKTKCQAAVKSWHGFVAELRDCDDEDYLFALLAYEAQTRKRPAFLDRIRSRYNRVRSYRELKELETAVGKVVNVNYV
jgi:hypothetical protein